MRIPDPNMIKRSIKLAIFLARIKRRPWYMVAFDLVATVLYTAVFGYALYMIISATWQMATSFSQ